MTRKLWSAILHRIALVMLLVWTACAHAAGLGSVQLLSGLGQPLRATVHISGDRINDLGSACINARIELSDGAFITPPRVGISHNRQSGIIGISTRQGINDPAITLHVEMGCGSTVYRSYQLLLDPVSFHSTATFPQSQKSTAARTTPNQRQANVALAKQKSTVNQSDKLPKKENVTPTELLPTFTKEMELTSNTDAGNGASRAQASRIAFKSPEKDNITPSLKYSATLTGASEADDPKKIEEFRDAQLRFAAIINDEDVTLNAEEKMKAAQQQMLLLQAENEKKKQQTIAVRAEQEAKKKSLFSAGWFIGIGVLLLACLGLIGWMASKLFRKKKAPLKHTWKNYHAASDTLIADLSTQTLMDSEFLTTTGDKYNTAVFSDTQYEPDTIIESDIEDESFEELDGLAPEQPDPGLTAATSTPEKATAEPARPRSTATSSQSPIKPDQAATDTKTAPVASAQSLTATTAPSPATIPAAQDKIQETPGNLKPALSRPVATNATATPPGSVKPTTAALTLKASEIADVMQQAEFWMLLQDPFRAIDILEPYRDVVQPESPVPWIYLLDLYRMVGDKKKYESLIGRIERVFNAKIPRWDGQFGMTPRTLNDFPHVVEKICDLWESDGIIPYLESLLIDQRDGARQGFDLPVYRNIVQLITLAREPEKSQQHEQLRYGKAQAILFSQQTPNLDHVAPANKDKTVDDSTIAENNSAPSNTVAAASSGVDKATTASGSGVTPSNPPDVIASPMETKLQLALAYQEIGEKDGARELLFEVIKDGASEQAEKAKAILKTIS